MDGGGDKRYNSIHLIKNLKFRSIKNKSKSLIGPMWRVNNLTFGHEPS